jgi:nitroreductase
LKECIVDINEAIRGRRSVREYSNRALSEQTIHRLIQAAVLAPNAVNQQPWTFTVVRDRTVMDRISREAKSYMLASVLPGHPVGEQTDRFRSILADPDYHIFYHAPALILISASSPGPWIVEDCALAAANLMLAAYADELGSCWIGFAQGYLNTPEGKRSLGIPANWVPVAPIILGYARVPAAATTRREPEIRWIG